MTTNFGRILIGVDGSAASDAAVQRAAGLSASNNAPVVVAHISQLNAGLFGVIKEVKSESDRLLADAADTISRAGGSVAVRFTAVEGIRGVAWDLLELARTEHVDLICLGSKGHGPWVGAVVGSTAQRVLHHAPCAVLLVPEPHVAGEEATSGEVGR